MNNLIRKKIILCLLDSDPKSADEIADEISESLETVDDQLTGLVSESICEKVSQGEISQYVVRKDVATFAGLVKEFLSNPEEHDQETEQFISSGYYLTRIDSQVIDYVLSRFHLGSVYQTDKNREVLRRILLVSPSALIFTLYGDTTFFDGMWSSRNQLDSSNATRDWINGILYSQFHTLLSEKLIADMEVPTYGILYAKFQILVARTTIQVDLATPRGKYVEVMGRRILSLHRAMEELPAGQPVSAVNPMAFSYDGLALMHLGEFQTALENFDKALALVQDPIQKAIVLNNKGWAFLQLKQYRRAIECFEEGIALDSGNEIPQLRDNKEVAKEYLARATDRENLNQPIQHHFVQGEPVPFEETSLCEFKEIKSRNPASRIEEVVDKYTVAFLNRAGGRIFWGIKDKDRTAIGVKLDDQVRNDIREKVPNKLGTIQPPISPEHWQLKFHNVYDSQEKTVEDLWVIELVVPPPQKRGIFYTSSKKLFVRDDGVTRELQGPAATEFILKHMQNDTETG